MHLVAPHPQPQLVMAGSGVGDLQEKVGVVGGATEHPALQQEEVHGGGGVGAQA